MLSVGGNTCGAGEWVRSTREGGQGRPGKKVAFEEGLDGEGGWADTRMGSVLAEWEAEHEEV